MHITIKVLPPLRPVNSLFERLTQHRTGEEHIQSVSIPAESTDTFEKLWKLAEHRYMQAYSKSHYQDCYFSKLQTLAGADIILHDTVGTLFDDKTPREELVLQVQRNALDRACSIPVGSILRPRGFRKRGLEGEQLEVVKRMRVQEGQYGAPVQSLDPDVPIASNEVDVEEDVDGERGEERGSRVGEGDKDADGFAIPARPIRQPRRRRKRMASVEETADATVRIQDSQIAPDPERVVTHRAATAIPANAAVEDTGLADRDAAVPTRAASQPAQKRKRLSDTKQPGPPTPESNGRLPSHEPPDSAQRSQPGRLPPVSAKSSRFLARSVPSDPIVPDPVEVSDPILDDEDTALLESFASIDDFLDEDDNGPATTEGDLPDGDNGNIAMDGPEDREESVPDVPMSEDTVSAIEKIRGSQLSAPPGSVGKWTDWEDKALLKGLRKSLSVSATLRRYKITRSESAARARKAILLKARKHDAMPSDSEAQTGPDPNAEPSSTSKKWTRDDVLVLEEGFRAGLTDYEIWSMFFKSRSQEAIIHKLRSCEQQFLRHIRLPVMHAADATGWTPRHTLKLARAVRESRTAQQTQKAFFVNFTVGEVRKRMREMGTGVLDTLSPERTPGLSSQHSRRERSEVQDHMAVQQDLPEDEGPSNAQIELTTAEKAAMTSSPPELRRHSSPCVVVTREERRKAARHLKKDKTTVKGGQTQLNFQREKGKAVDRPPRESNARLEELFSRRTSNSSAIPVSSNQRLEATNKTTANELAEEAVPESSVQNASKPSPEIPSLLQENTSPAGRVNGSLSAPSSRGSGRLTRAARTGSHSAALRLVRQRAVAAKAPREHETTDGAQDAADSGPIMISSGSISPVQELSRSPKRAHDQTDQDVLRQAEQLAADTGQVPQVYDRINDVDDFLRAIADNDQPRLLQMKLARREAAAAQRGLSVEEMFAEYRVKHGLPDSVTMDDVPDWDSEEIFEEEPSAESEDEGEGPAMVRDRHVSEVEEDDDVQMIDQAPAEVEKDDLSILEAEHVTAPTPSEARVAPEPIGDRHESQSTNAAAISDSHEPEHSTVEPMAEQSSGHAPPAITNIKTTRPRPSTRRFRLAMDVASTSPKKQISRADRDDRPGDQLTQELERSQQSSHLTPTQDSGLDQDLRPQSGPSVSDGYLTAVEAATPSPAAVVSSPPEWSSVAEDLHKTPQVEPKEAAPASHATETKDVVATTEPPNSKALKDAEMMPPPTSLPQRHSQRSESFSSMASSDSTLSRIRQDGSVASRQALKKSRRRQRKSNGAASGSERSTSVSATPSQDKVAENVRPALNGSSQFDISDSLKEFRGKQFRFAKPKPAAPPRVPSMKLPYATDDEDDDDESVVSE